MKAQVGLILLTLFMVGSASFAYERRHSPFFCFTKTDDRGEMDFDDVSKGVRNRSEGVNWDRRTLICPVLVDDTLPLRGIRTLTIQGWDGDGGDRGTVGAKACVTFRWARGGECGHQVVDGDSSRMGLFELQFRQETPGDPLDKWRGFHVDYPYVEITLPGRAGDFSTVFGYVVTD